MAVLWDLSMSQGSRRTRVWGRVGDRFKDEHRILQERKKRDI